MKNKSTVAQCAAAIRQELKAKFPQTRFSVKSSNYSMGDSVRVSWADGAAQDKVEELLAKYKYGRFDGMQDIYECTNHRNDIPQTKYLFCEREISDEIYLAKFEELRKSWNILEEIASSGAIDLNSKNQRLWEATCYWSIKEFIGWRLGYFKDVDLAKEEPKKEIESIKVEGFELVDYSEKAIALFGNTKEIREKLKELGGRFNPFLTKNGEKMAGWIFSKSKESQLKILIA